MTVAPKIALYINDKIVDIENYDKFAAQFALTMNFSDLYEPDKVVDSYSKQIDLPGTTNNNKIFGEIWNVGADNISVFNPNVLSDFRIELNGDTWQTGSVQLVSIVRKFTNITYKIALYGKITHLFSVLLNDNIDDDNNKLLRSLHYTKDLKHPLDKTLIRQMWNGHYGVGINLSRYMQYIPCNNGLYANFDSNNELTLDSSGNIAVDQITRENFNLDEYQRGEYRVEYQRPAIKIDELMKQIAYEAAPDASINFATGTFFNRVNPYWGNSYLTLSQYTRESSVETVTGNMKSLQVYVPANRSYTDIDLQFKAKDGKFEIFDDEGYNQNFDLTSVSGSKKINVEFRVRVEALLPAEYTSSTYLWPFYLVKPGSVGSQIELSDAETWNVSMTLSSSRPTIVGTPYTSSRAETIFNEHNLFSTIKSYENSAEPDSINKTWNTFGMYSYNPEYALYAFPMEQFGARGILGYYEDLNYKPFGFTFNANGADGTSAHIKLSFDNITHHLAMARMSSLFSTGLTRMLEIPDVQWLIIVEPIVTANNNVKTSLSSAGFSLEDIKCETNSAIGSGSIVSTRDMFDRETTQGKVLLDYTKLLGFIYDTQKDGTVDIVTRNDYFTGYKILDWSDKVDYSKEFTIKPLTFDTKNLEMKLQSGKSYYETKYLNEYGLDYGSQRINTGFPFNTKTTTLLNSDFFTTITSKDKRTEAIVTKTEGEKDPTKFAVMPPYVLPAYYTKSGNDTNSINTKYNLLFRSGIQDLGYVPVFITESSDLMYSENNDHACWVTHVYGDETLDALKVQANSIPLYTTHYQDASLNTTCSWDISYPRCSYDGSDINTYPENSTVFSRFWKSYYSELYNSGNRIVTCSVMLDNNDLKDFSFKNFVSINGTLYHPNKLIDANPLNNEPTKVELITVKDITAYTDGQNIDDLIGYVNIHYDLTKVVIIPNITTVRVGDSLNLRVVTQVGYTIMNVYIWDDDGNDYSACYDPDEHRIKINEVTDNLFISIYATEAANVRSITLVNEYTHETVIEKVEDGDSFYFEVEGTPGSVYCPICMTNSDGDDVTSVYTELHYTDDGFDIYLDEVTDDYTVHYWPHSTPINLLTGAHTWTDVNNTLQPVPSYSPYAGYYYLDYADGRNNIYLQITPRSARVNLSIDVMANNIVITNQCNITRAGGHYNVIIHYSTLDEYRDCNIRIYATDVSDI